MTPADPGLPRLELLREFKRKMPRADLSGNVSPFDAQVSTALGNADADVPEMHAEVRQHIRETVTLVRDGKKQSQVVLLSGAAGVGKTHLLRTFRTPEASEELGHIFVGGSNHWTVGEFQAQLLDWVIAALTAPSPAEKHPLLERIEAIGFRAVEHLLENPVSWKNTMTRPGGRFIGRLLRRWTRPPHEQLKALTTARNPEVFAHFDFAEFGRYVCDRFLAERSNLFHRYALRVLLTYLFPDKPETGVGTRERVLHWFRGRGDDDYFTRRLGASDRPDRAYSQFEAVKLLAHLFSPAVSAQLATEQHPCPPRVLLLTFDQAEGRNELFDDDDDWKTFFAHLSELYNTLPNVVVLFTMTLTLRNRLHAVMERQFRDRIRMDERFTLALPDKMQLLGLYRTRLEAWIGDAPDLRERYAALANPYLPFTEDEVLKTAGNQTVRDALAVLNTAFHEAVRSVTVDAAIDYLFERNDRKQAESESTVWEYTADHLNTVCLLLESLGESMARDAGLEIRTIELTKLENVPVLRFGFGLPNQAHSITVYLARMGWNFKNQIGKLVGEFLYNREKARTFLWAVRPQPLPETLDVVPDRYQTQFTTGVCPADVESVFLALTAVNANRGKYQEPAQLSALDELIRTEVSGTYLGKLFRHARAKLEALATGVPATDPSEATV